MTKDSLRPRVVILGGGFGGLYAAQSLKKAAVDVTVIDRRNFHLFQPLLYQIATGGLSPGDIASPLRSILNKQKNTQVLTAEVQSIDVKRKRVLTSDGDKIGYDFLIVATGSSHHYFGHDAWAQWAPGLKTVEDAIEMRRRIFEAFEEAEKSQEAEARKKFLNFVIVGGGPTGVELAGALAELAQVTLRKDFRNIDPAKAKIYLLEGTDRVLPPYSPKLSAAARKSLEALGVTVRTSTLLTDVSKDRVTVSSHGKTEVISTATILWAAGVQASPLGRKLAEAAGTELDRAGRVKVGPDLSLPSHPEIFVIGDLAHALRSDGTPLPGIAPVAMQQGAYVAKAIVQKQKSLSVKPFRYCDKGNLAVIGRNAAVAEIGKLRFKGFPAWFLWVAIHILYLIEFDNKVMVLFQWAWNYFTRKRGARLITGEGMSHGKT